MKREPSFILENGCKDGHSWRKNDFSRRLLSFRSLKHIFFTKSKQFKIEVKKKVSLLRRNGNLLIQNYDIKVCMFDLVPSTL